MFCSEPDDNAKSDLRVNRSSIIIVKWNNYFLKPRQAVWATAQAGNTKGGSITVLLTSCLTGMESAV